MKEGFEYRLFSYTFTTYCQGTADRGNDWALLYVPENSTFNNTRSVLINKKHREGIYEIDIESVEDMTIQW